MRDERWPNAATNTRLQVILPILLIEIKLNKLSIDFLFEIKSCVKKISFIIVKTFLKTKKNILNRIS